MAKKQVAVNPAETISAMRSDALLAYLEWPVFLHIRLKELNEALAITGESQSVSTASNELEPGQVVIAPAKVEPSVPESKPVVNFVPDIPTAPQTDAVTDFLAQFPDGEGNAS